MVAVGLSVPQTLTEKEGLGVTEGEPEAVKVALGEEEVLTVGQREGVRDAH